MFNQQSPSILHSRKFFVRRERFQRFLEHGCPRFQLVYRSLMWRTRPTSNASSIHPYVLYKKKIAQSNQGWAHSAEGQTLLTPLHSLNAFSEPCPSRTLELVEPNLGNLSSAVDIIDKKTTQRGLQGIFFDLSLGRSTDELHLFAKTIEAGLS